MFKSERLVKGVVRAVQRAGSDVMDSLASTRIEQETSVTDRLLQAVEAKLDGKVIAGVSWLAKTLTDKGPNSQEKEFGADFMGVLSISLDGFATKKGFLAQAKLVEPSKAFPASEFSRLKAQCERMLKHTAASYVFLYSAESGVRIVPAIGLVGARSCNPHEMTSKSMAEFFAEHLECFIGDQAIYSASRRGLEALRADYGARALLLLVGSSNSRPRIEAESLE